MYGVYANDRFPIRLTLLKFQDLGFIGVILGLYWGYMGIMEKNMEATIMGYVGLRVSS